MVNQTVRSLFFMTAVVMHCKCMLIEIISLPQEKTLNLKLCLKPPKHTVQSLTLVLTKSKGYFRAVKFKYSPFSNLQYKWIILKECMDMLNIIIGIKKHVQTKFSTYS